MSKRLDKINLTFKIIISLFGVGLFIASLIDPVAWPKTWSYLATIIIPFGPDIIKFFGLNTSTRLQIAYSLFLGLAMVAGIDFDLYKTWYIFGNPCFDKVAHCLSGVLAAFVAKEILDRNYDGTDVKVTGGGKAKVKHYDTRFTWLFIVAFVALTAAVWECYEFLYDQTTGGNMQTLIADGLDDTMWDIVGALGLGIIAAFPLSKK
jgi:hypothetical protein